MQGSFKLTNYKGHIFDTKNNTSNKNIILKQQYYTIDHSISQFKRVFTQ